MKLRSLHIEEYKMFKDFDISFVDEDDKPLDIVVLAGVNGSGKTTLLEYIANFIEYLENKRLPINDFVEIILQREAKGLGSLSLPSHGLSAFSSSPLPFDRIKIKNENFKEYAKRYENNIIYLPIYENNIFDLKESILTYYRYLVRTHHHIEALKKIQDFLDSIFTDDIDITFTIDDINIVERDNEKIIFKNKNEDSFELEQLSTGEKTLLSKVLYLFFRNYKDKIILIDEPELSLHPKWQNQVLKIYKNFAEKNECQIIIATHSPHIITSAKNRYIRFLEKDDAGNVTAMNDIQAYGRDIEWVLEQMGVKNLRVSDVLEQFTKCQQLLNDEKYDEAEECIDALEEEIGQNDRQIMNLRNSLFFERD